MAPTSTARRLATGAAFERRGPGPRRRRLLRPAQGGGPRRPPQGRGAHGQGGPALGRRRLRPGPRAPLVLVVLGDSSAVGLGVERAAETPGVLDRGRAGRGRRAARAPGPPRGLRRGVPRPRRPGRAGAARAARRRPDHDRRQRRHRPEPAGGRRPAPHRRRAPAARRGLRGRGRHLPRPRHHPARSPSRCAGSPAGGAGRWPPPRPSRSSRPAAAPCRLGSLLGPAFASDRTLFSSDEFHPSAAGYAAAAAVLLPSVADALGSGRPRPTAALRALRRDTVRPVAQAAARAANRRAPRCRPPRWRGSHTGPRGPWALLRRRRPPDLPTPDAGRIAEESARGRPSPLRLEARPPAGRGRARLPRSSFGGDPTSGAHRRSPPHRGGLHARSRHRRHRPLPDRPRLQGLAEGPAPRRPRRHRSSAPRWTRCPRSTRTTSTT